MTKKERIALLEAAVNDLESRVEMLEGILLQDIIDGDNKDDGPVKTDKVYC